MNNRNVILSGGGYKTPYNLFHKIIDIENLFLAWREFRRGKRKKLDVQGFEFNLENNLFSLQEALSAKAYQHSDYTSFYIQDPKLRHIHKACVSDRIVHQAVFRVLYPVFDKDFIYDSYSSRFEKGTHAAVSRLELFIRKLSRNYRCNIFAMKCDVKKFFNSVDQKILVELIQKKIQNGDCLWLIKEIIGSFKKTEKRGLPLGNVTSQLFANIYLNELDQFVKHKLKIKYYIRYCDDFVTLGKDKNFLLDLVKNIEEFLQLQLNLELHKDKIIIRKYRQGIDFLGYVVLPHYKVLRTKTKRRLFRKIIRGKQALGESLIKRESFNSSLQSYFGVLKHCSGFKIKKILLEVINEN